MTTLADLKVALDAQAQDVPLAEDVLARARGVRPHHRGLLVAAAAVVALAVAVLVVVLRSGTSAAPADHAWKTFRTAGFSVRYPPTWHAATYQVVSSFSAAIVFLGDQPMSDPCTTNRVNSGVETSCRGAAANHLVAGGVVISWFNTGFPGLDSLPADGHAETIGGFAAKVLVGTNQGCTGSGGRTSVVATIRRARAPGNFLHMDACVAAPRNSRQVKQVLESLRSMRQNG